MPPIRLPSQSILIAAQQAFRRDAVVLFEQMAAQIIGRVRLAASRGRVGELELRRLQARVGNLVEAYFVGDDGRSPFADDGVTAVAPFPALLNRHLVRLARQIVQAQAVAMRQRMSPGLLSRMGDARRVVAEQAGSPFSDNPLALYTAPHEWADANGYRLSDRIWRAGFQTRAKIDRVLSEGVRKHWPIERIADELETLLRPERLGVRTRKPYGRNVSFDAMRLARTELTRMHGQVMLAASRANPYVDEIWWNLSASHPAPDICDALAAGSPYDLNDPTVTQGYPAHPHEMCYLTPGQSRSTDNINAELDAFFADDGESPPLTPLHEDLFLLALLGAVLFSQGRADERAAPERL